MFIPITSGHLLNELNAHDIEYIYYILNVLQHFAWWQGKFDIVSSLGSKNLHTKNKQNCHRKPKNFGSIINTSHQRITWKQSIVIEILLCEGIQVGNKFRV